MNASMIACFFASSAASKATLSILQPAVLSYGSNSDSIREATTLLIENNREAGSPDDTVWSLAYNYQEQVIVNLYADRLKEYVRKERNRFISGIIDPASDEDWNAYVNGLSSLGLESCTLAAQSAWDRMNR